NAKKSAHAWINSMSTQPLGMVINGNLSPFEALSDNKPYNYLGYRFQLNMHLEPMLEQILNKFQSVINHIIKKKYLHIKLKITLINMVAIPILQYRMKAFLLPFQRCQNL